MTEVKQHAKTVLQNAVDEAAVQMQNAMAQSVNEVSGDIGSMVQTGFSQEFQQYQVSLSELQSRTIEHIGKLQTEVDQRKQELLGQLEAKADRKRDGEGREGTVRVEHGGHSIIKKKKK